MSEPSSTQPIFTTTRDQPDNVDTFDTCAAAGKAAGRGRVLGTQRIGALWRLDPVGGPLEEKKKCMGENSTEEDWDDREVGSEVEE
ncbi:hypothetical protein ElyMa_002932500 [Elysia marginata]|uniref:Uncharacterized protein n=1 Tax=Elysia marginata TaxID=1093978 RepID=A0AAV4I7Z5_9GAST|nr:hypothetical protein ElyMa_002932500 [Elysia marginata]